MDIGGLLLLLPQESDTTTTNIIYLEVLLWDNVAVVVAIVVGQ